MKKCPVCNYELAAFEVDCPRCRRGATNSTSSRLSVTTASSPTSVPRTAKSQSPAAIPFSWLSGTLAAAAAFFLPAAVFTMFSMLLASESPRTPTTPGIVLVVIVCFFAPLLGGWGGYIASSQGRFWWGAAAGAAFAALWALLCRALSSDTGNSTSIDTSLLVAILAILIYEGGAVYGGIQRAQNGLAPVDAGIAFSFIIGILCFAFPLPGIAATVLLSNSDSDYRRPALIGTIAGMCVWLLLFMGAAARNSHS